MKTLTEVGALREALEEIANLPGPTKLVCGGSTSMMQFSQEAIQNLARAGLNRANIFREYAAKGSPTSCQPEGFSVRASGKVMWRPTTPGQTRFLRSTDLEVLFGGPGSGKTDALLVRAIKFALNPPLGYDKPWEPSRNRSIIFRRTYPMLAPLIERSHQLCLPFGATFNKAQLTWTFPSGGTFRFGYGDPHKFAGDDFSFIGFDCLDYWANEADYLYLMSRLRIFADAGIPVQMASTSSLRTDSPGRGWISKRWLIPSNISDYSEWCTEADGHTILLVYAGAGFRNPYYIGEGVL